PSEILSKPGEISDAEFNLIKAHPTIGHSIVKGIDFPWPVAQAVLQHHEMMDGSGYPGGLSGENIILEARVLAVSDVVEAMASHRPYRPALGMERALKQISEKRGVLYDSRVVDACLRVFAAGFEL
ncbi:MAG: HD domain-containing protein, partial [Dehalococcoidia bacterium]|nr:HD domain-containing protein [Dehalococcoidia bacterium]